MGFFLFLILFVLVLGLALVGSVLNFFLRLFSFGRKRPASASASHAGGESSSSARSGKKVFGKEEGEYVDFEEVKE